MDAEYKAALLPEETVVKKQSCCHRKITRLKAAGLIFILILTATFITFFCLSGNSGHITQCKPLHRLKYPSAQKRLPHSIIIGVRKAGTGALRHFLGLHPDIAMAAKEPNFFSYRYDKGFEWYRNMMPFSVEGQITMEKSSNNFHSSKAPERTFQMNNTLKVIVVVREPVDRAMSDYTQRVVNKKNKRTFEEAFYNVKSGKVNSDYNCIKPSLYYKHMKRWLQYFPRKQIHVVDGENLRRNPYEEVYKVENFLGLGHKVTKGTFVFNETKGFFCFKNESEQVECLRENKGRKHTHVDAGVVRMLRQYFRPLNQKFYHLIGHHFDW